MKSNREVKPGTTYSPQESMCELTYSIIKQAVSDTLDGDYEASQFLVAPDGAELWLKANGIGVTREMRTVLALLAIGAK